MAEELRSRAAFRDAFRAHYPRAVLAARRVLGDDPRAEDAAQDAFFRLWRDPARFDRTRGDLGSYVALMARSRAIDLWRSDRALESARDRTAALSMRDPGPPDPAERAVAAVTGAAVRAELRKLPPPQREALVLAHWGGLTIRQIALRTGVPLGTAKGRLRLGAEKLAALLPRA